MEVIVAVEVVIEECKNSFISKVGKTRQLKWLYREMQTASEFYSLPCKLEYQVRTQVLHSCSWDQDLWLLMENDLAFAME